MSQFNFRPCPLPNGGRVWLYFRDSGGETQDLASQRAYGLAYCQHYGLTIERVFEDAAISGESVIKRDEFETMITLARSSKNPLVEGLIYWDIKRFARNQNDSQYYKADLRRRGYRLISLSDDIPDNEFSGIFEAFLEWKAEKDRADISKDSKRGLAYIIGLKHPETGHYLGIFPGRPPTFFGGEPFNVTDLYPETRRNNGQPRIVQRLVSNPDTWPLGKTAMEMRAAGISYADIETALKLFPRSLYPAGIYSGIFGNEIYIGRLHYGGRVYDEFVPSLTTPEQWRAIQAQRSPAPKKGEGWKRDKHPRRKASTFLLSGLCNCGYCNCTMNGETNKHKERAKGWRYYVCTRKRRQHDCASKQMSADRLEQAVVSEVLGQVLTVDLAIEIIEIVNEGLRDKDTRSRQLEREQDRLSDLTRAIKNLLDLVEVHPSIDLVKRLGEREAERSATSRTIEALKRIVNQTAIIADGTLVARTIEQMRGELLQQDQRSRRQALREVVERVDVWREKVNVSCAFPASRFWEVPPTGYVLNTWQIQIEIV